jgi:hypothetical protein
VTKWRKWATVEDLKTAPKKPRSTVLTDAEEATVVVFRRHALLHLGDCLCVLQPSIAQLTLSALRWCLQQHGISRLHDVSACKSGCRNYSVILCGYFNSARVLMNKNIFLSKFIKHLFYL